MGTIEAADTGDDRVLSSKNITVAAYVAAPLLAFALLACFCARRRSRDSDSARTAARNSWAKGGASAGLGGLGGHGQQGGNAAVAGAPSLDSGAPGSTKIFPTSRSLSPKRKNSRVMTNAVDLEEMNLAGDLVVGGTAAAVVGASKGRGNNKNSKPQKFARCGSDTAFAVTSSEDVGDAAAAGGRAATRGGAAYSDRGGGGVESDSSGGAGTGRSSSPAGYEDDAAASAFDGGSMGRRVQEDDELSENGWGSFRRTSMDKAGSGPPSYEETQRRDRGGRELRQEQRVYNGDGLGTRSHSNRERNSERTLALAAARAGRHAVPRRSGAARATDGSRSVSLR